MLSRLQQAGIFLHAFIRTRYGFRFSNRAALENWQQRRVSHFLQSCAQHIPYYRAFAGKPLPEWPLMQKEQMQQHFAELNQAGISLQQAQQFGLTAEKQRAFSAPLQPGIAVGLSSGTSGQRGVFLVSDKERARWAGVILARVLKPAHLRQLLNPFAKPLSVAFLLRANSKLYTTVHNARLHFHYGDLQQSLSALVNWLQGVQPQILIAPASVLAALARAQLQGSLQIQPQQVISVAEVLEADDKLLVQQAWRQQAGQIYQCTEGLLAYTCEHGQLHLNEEWLHIQPHWLDDERFTPEITDFGRETQAFVRYRLDDVLRVSSAQCRCGRHSRVLSAIEGRQDDVLWLPAADSSMQPVFPDKLRHLMMQLQPAIEDYRIEQHGIIWLIRLQEATQLTAEQISALQHQTAAALFTLFLQQQLQAPEIRFAGWEAMPAGQKRRRIRCQQSPHKE
ncbi:F390 synthetase-related protein [Undibacterium luofuense]|uniref:Adenylate-forming enzyme n=1 Tax=Undibacterium luofuense TaxID=2828733 RepID=A0A941DLB8_9BURK|nr:F390 synthetase-related protein [Undibacterium luofuense]MBR7781642.1 hypothetical protein [Undibacterium luofuense]